MNNSSGYLKINELVGDPQLIFEIKDGPSSVITFVQNGDLIFSTVGNFIFKGGWLFSWTSYLLGGLILILFFWNIWITLKLRDMKEVRKCQE